MLYRLPRVVFIAIFLAGSYLVEALKVEKISDTEEPTNDSSDALLTIALPSQTVGNIDLQGAVPAQAPVRSPPSEVRSLHQKYNSGNTQEVPDRANHIKALRRRALESRATKHHRPYSSSNYKNSRRRLPKSGALNNPSPSSSPSPSNTFLPLPQKNAKDGSDEKLLRNSTGALGPKGSSVDGSTKSPKSTKSAKVDIKKKRVQGKKKKRKEMDTWMTSSTSLIQWSIHGKDSVSSAATTESSRMMKSNSVAYSSILAWTLLIGYIMMNGI